MATLIREKTIECRFFETLLHITESGERDFLNDYLHIVPNREDHIDDMSFRIYHSAGYCWEVTKEYTCKPDEIAQFQFADADGCTYCFLETWEGFKKTGVKYALYLVENATNTWLDAGWSLDNLM